MKIFWFLPTHGDSRYLGTSEGARQVDLAYLQQIAVAEQFFCAGAVESSRVPA